MYFSYSIIGKLQLKEDNELYNEAEENIVFHQKVFHAEDDLTIEPYYEDIPFGGIPICELTKEIIQDSDLTPQHRRAMLPHEIPGLLSP
ncbi:hypothetical protein [Bathymodiolus platifrons methanotrophic gill symbiont]|uniref:hypothetical protein n=1 Tax=Bathymodiolus platifrons methanotrophic gill symbiont TaxID=113268 RepID=UPI001C8DF1EB|nr:hypothetical protein [Bathymodiolus platifrons methanotrophic gill symbiont]